MRTTVPQHTMEVSALTLVADAVSKSFGGLRAVDSVSFEVRPGQLVSLVGPNGAGKTTCFHTLAGSLPLTSGRVSVGGEDISRLRPDQRAARGVGRTFQTTSLFNGLTCVENVQVALSARRPYSILRSLLTPWRTPDTTAEAIELLERVGAAGHAHEQADELSYGAQRRLAVAVALATEPEYLLLDEPAAGLNPKESRSFGELLRSLVSDGMGVLLVEHDMGLVMEVSDWVHVLAQGRTLAAGEPAEVRNDPAVVAAYLGRR